MLIDLTRNSGLSDAEVQSMVGGLNWLRNESISKTGRKGPCRKGPWTV